MNMSPTAHASFQPTCGICRSLYGESPKMPIYEDELWHVRHIDPPWGVAGWMMLISKRHVAGIAHFDDREAASFGHAIRHFEHILEEVTGALRIYTAAMGESNPHFHCHMIPRYATMPNDAKAWGVFDLQRAAAAGEVSVDEPVVVELIEKYHRALIAHPPPHG
jgi:diadenosine tetraphosphate (Ap4A) HIT family hydrolase